MDRDLLERFRNGDETAIKAVYERFSGAVFALSLRILRDHGLAADATQQTFIKAWENSHTFDPTRPLAPWVYTIARRTAIDLYRKQRRILSSEKVDEVELPPEMDQIWQVFEVRSALDQLSDEEREVMRLSHLEGLTHREIADSLGIPLGTVKSRSHRAHQRLLQILDHLGED